MVTAAIGSCSPLHSKGAAAPGLLQTTVVEPVGKSEKELLTKLDSLPSDTRTNVASFKVLASQSFHSASGRTCRRLQWTDSQSDAAVAQERLACNDGKIWFYVPDVLSHADSWGNSDSSRVAQPKPALSPRAPAALAAPK